MAGKGRPLAITMGDPRGIGIEITAKSWKGRNELDLPPFFLIGHLPSIRESLEILDLEVEVEEISDCREAPGLFANRLPVLEPPTTADISGQILGSIDLGVKLCLEKSAGALVTNPIHKKRLYDAGFKHPGHTEYLAALTGNPEASVMMLACPELKVVPASVHIPLSKVPETITTERLARVIETTHADLVRWFGKPAPRIVVAALNPHAGEEGTIGDEEVRVIHPVVEDLRKRGLNVEGPFSADSLFHKSARETYDAAICMYHDQALIPLKTIDFDNGVNVTLGLPIIRTSPDHGTADDIVGKGVANPASLIAAIRMAAEMSGNDT